MRQSNRFGIAKQMFLLAAAMGLWAFIIYVRFIAGRDSLLFIAGWHIDKAAHVLGGLFLIQLVEWRSARPRLPMIVLLLAVVTVGWELLEFGFDAETKFFYSYAPDLWLLDSLGDIAAGFLGGYGYWVFWSNRSRRLTGRPA